MTKWKFVALVWRNLKSLIVHWEHQVRFVSEGFGYTYAVYSVRGCSIWRPKSPSQLPATFWHFVLKKCQGLWSDFEVQNKRLSINLKKKSCHKESKSYIDTTNTEITINAAEEFSKNLMYLMCVF